MSVKQAMDIDSECALYMSAGGGLAFIVIGGMGLAEVTLRRALLVGLFAGIILWLYKDFDREGRFPYKNLFGSVLGAFLAWTFLATVCVTLDMVFHGN